MQRRYFGTDPNLAPPEELGLPISLRRIESIANDLLGDNSPGKAAALQVGKSIREFLVEQRKQGRVLNRQLIYGLLVDCLKFEKALSDREKKARTKFFKDLQNLEDLPYVVVGKRTGTTEKSCFRSELYWTLMFQPSHEVDADVDRRFMCRNFEKRLQD